MSQTTAPATKRWNTWIDGKDTWNDNSSANYNLDGPLFNGLAGIDYKLADKVTFGILGSLENSHLDGTGVNTRSNGLGAGPYLGITIGDHLVFSANALGSSIDSSQSGFYRYSADRLQAAAALNGYWYSGVWRFTPGLSLSWSKEWQKENHNLTPDQTIEAALLTPSVQFGRTFQISDRSTMEPWLGTALDWTFVNRIRIDGFAPLNRPSTDLRLQAGLNFAFGGNMQLSLTGEVGGLLLKDLNTYAGEANLAVQF
ncbi:MAG: autotransporter outer membrane beta-barrel domain-containing protein [Rhizobiales bacterium]|nr:autotransporter outer membrane beta-barrel domain-containing protein [Hyphomicrobiales bacterium]